MLHRFHLPAPLVVGDHVRLEGEELHHAVRVVRVRTGEAIELFDGRGTSVRGVVEALDREHALVRIEETMPSRESRTTIDLAMAIINLDKFELVLQKATELGIRAILPLETERCEVRVERYRGKGERWNKIVFEAVKQCGRSVIPAVEAPAPFADVVAREGTKLFFDADAEAGARPGVGNSHPHPAFGHPLPQAGEGSRDERYYESLLPLAGEGARRADEGVAHDTAAAPPPITLFIGPEGGWSEAEIALARNRKCTFQRLGPRRLRAETAAIVAATIVSARHGDI